MPRSWLFAFLFVVALFGDGLLARAQSNDNFVNRLTLTGSHPLAVSNNLRATHEAGEPYHAGAGVGRSLWYTWTAPTTGTVNISTYDTQASAPTMRAVAVYVGNAVDALSEVASSNDLYQLEYLEEIYSATAFPTGTSINVPVTAGTVYQLAVDALPTTLYPDDGKTVLAIDAPPTIVSAADATGTTGANFSYAVLATGGPTSYAATGLPTGLALNTATGQITGLAVATGTYAVGLSATGPGGTGTATLTLCFSDPVPVTLAAPVIYNDLSVLAYVGQSFSSSINASGVPTTYTASNLPAGLTLYPSSGVLSGTPTTAGIYTVPVSATNAVGTGSATLTFNVTTPSLPIITSGLSASGTTGSSFTYSINANLDDYSGVAPTSWAATNLPPGLAMSATSDYFTGTPTQAGVYPVTISATNAAGTRQAVVTVTITAPPAAPVVTAAPVLSSLAMAQGVVGTTFGYALAATQSPTSFGAGNLPPGVTFNTGTGAFAGAPTTAGTYLVPVTATNAFGTSTGTLTVTIFASAAAQSAANGVDVPAIVSAASTIGYVGQSLSYGIVAEIEGSPYFETTSGAWTFTATGLPPGLSVTGSRNSSAGYGTISGTPTSAGTYQATITATCPTGYPEQSPYNYYGEILHPASTGTAIVTFVINTGSAAAAPVITSSATYSLAVGSATYVYISASGSPTSYAASNLPPGLSINATSGEISGTPTTAGTCAASISAANATGTGMATISFNVAAYGSVPLITGSATPSGTVGTAFSYSIYVSGGATSYGASNLPPGLSFSTSSGTFSGTPTQTGVYTVPVSATNANGVANATLTFTILSSVATRPPAITSYAVAQATTGQYFDYYLDTDITATSYTVGSLPPGLSFTAGSDDIGGTPTTAGTYTVPISASNAVGACNATLTIVVSNPAVPVFTSACALAATVGQSFYSYVSASNYPTSYAFSGLPAGITASSSTPGYLSGTPTAAGVYTVSVSAVNVSGTASVALTITVAAATSSTTAAPLLFAPLSMNGSIGDPFSNYANANTSNATITALSALPPGLSLNATTGQLTGTPTQAGTYPVTFQAANSGGSSQGVVTITIATTASEVPGIESASTIIALEKEPIYFPVATSPAAASYGASGLPGGVTIDPVSGLISGNVPTPGIYPITVTASNSAGQGTATLTLTVVAPAFAVTTTPMALSAKVNQPFTTTLTNSGNSAANSAASGLPPGLNINAATGVISGTPTTAGIYNATTTQTSEYGTVTGYVTFFVGTSAPATPVFTTPGGLGGYVDTPFSYKLLASNSPTSFNLITALPPGLTFNYSTGTILGTPTTTGTYTVEFLATNASGTSRYSLMAFTIGAVSTAPLQVISMAGMWWTANTTSLSYSVTANLPLFSVTGATNLPPGLSFTNSISGTISGTPTTAGRYDVKLSLTNGYTGAVSSAVVNFRIDATDPTVPQLLSYASTTGAVGCAFSYTAQAFGVPSVTMSSLPGGLSYNASTKTIMGTPTVAGTYQVPMSATNANGTSTGTLTIVIAPPPAPTLAVSSNALERMFTVDTTSSTSSLWYINTTGTATSFAASGLPPGLSVNITTGQITGTLTTVGAYPVTVSAANATGSASAVITYVVSPVAALGPPAISSLAASLNAFVGVPISTVSLYATNSPTTYGASGLPPGLAFNTASGQITGTPTTLGTYTVNLSATNAAGTGTAVWTVIVNNVSVLNPVFNEISAEISGTVGQSTYYGFYAYAYYGGSDTNATTAITVSGLPTGIQVYESSADYLEISGPPTAAGTYPLTLTATAPGGTTATVTCMLVVAPAPAPTITSAAGALGNVNNAFTYGIYASNTVAAFTANNLPPGLTLNTVTGQITGTPMATGTTAVSVSATGPYGTGSAVITIRIDPPLYGGLPVITSAAAISSQDVPQEVPYNYYPFAAAPVVNYTLTALNGPATFTLTNLPAGLVFNAYTNTITGQPLAGGVFPVPVTATNAAGTVNATLTILSGAPLVFADVPLAQSSYVGESYNAVFPTYYPSLGSYNEPYEYPYYYYEGNGEDDPVTFTAAGLPPGLSINSYEGEIMGIFTQAGTYPVTLTASNVAEAGSAICTFTVAATAPASTGVTTAPTMSGEAQLAGFIGVPVSYSLYGAGASSYAVTGLPGGLVCNAATGQISGTPTTTGVYPVTVSAANSAGTTQAVLTVTVDAAPPAPVLEGECTDTATIGTAFYDYIDAYSNYAGLPAVTGYVASGLPAGLSLNATTGQISGTPTGPAGVYPVSVTAFIGPVTMLGGVLTLTVQNPPAVTTQPVMTSAAGALGLVGNPFSYAIYSAAFMPDTGSLPPGLSYNAATGVISGYPTATGTYVVPLSATGTSGGSGSTNLKRQKSARRPPIRTNTGNAGLSSVLTISVLAPDSSLPRLIVQPVGGATMAGNSYIFAASALGAPAPTYQWRHNGVVVSGVTGSLLTLNAVQPADAGMYSVTAANTAGSVTSSVVTLLVNTSFAQWQSACFSAQQIAAGLAADNANPSGDGVPNLLKYALDLDPNVPVGNGALTSVTHLAGGSLQMTFARDAGETDIDYLVESTSDLSAAAAAGWTTVAEGDAGAAVTAVNYQTSVTETPVAGTNQVQVTVQTAPSTGNGAEFLQLRIVRP